MKAYKCDICGGLYEQVKGLEIKGKCFITKEYKGTYADEFSTGRPSLVDICPDCTSAIQKVIDERSKENE